MNNFHEKPETQTRPTDARGRMIGFKLAHDLKQRVPGTPVILISGYTLWNPEELSNVDAYVGKGSTFDSLLTNIRVLMGRGGKHFTPSSQDYSASGAAHSVVNAL